MSDQSLDGLKITNTEAEIEIGMSNTPRTDALLPTGTNAEQLCYALKRSRQLETELNEAKIEIENVKEQRNKAALEERQKYLPQLAELKAHAEKAEKACALMRDYIEPLNDCKCLTGGGEFKSYPCAYHEALSSTCGQDYIHKDKVKPIVEALEVCSPMSHYPSEEWDQLSKLRKQALTLAKELGITI